MTHDEVKISAFPGMTDDELEQALALVNEDSFAPYPQWSFWNRAALRTHIKMEKQRREKKDAV